MLLVSSNIRFYRGFNFPFAKIAFDNGIILFGTDLAPYRVKKTLCPAFLHAKIFTRQLGIYATHHLEVEKLKVFGRFLQFYENYKIE